jgi:hypothetical protein
MTTLKPGDKFKLANNSVEVYSIDEPKDKIYLIIFGVDGTAQLHREGFGLKWVLEGFESGVNTLIENKSWI